MVFPQEWSVWSSPGCSLVLCAPIALLAAVSREAMALLVATSVVRGVLGFCAAGRTRRNNM